LRKFVFYFSFVLILASSIAALGQVTTLPKVENVKFESKLVGAALPYNVVLPPGYSDPAEKNIRYPVLYLLHGLFGSGNDWVSNRAHLAQYAAMYHLIIVTPEGHDGWYTDSATVPAERYESYIIQELIPDVDSRYRTISSRDARAIAGLSMGGYGAMKFGLKFPDKFVFAASMSGALQAPELDQIPQVPAFILTSVKRAFGPVDSPVRANNDIYKLVGGLLDDRKKQLPYFYLDCGTEDDLVQSNRKFSGMLISAKIRHEFRELPGTHSWPYWDQQVQEVLRIATRIFNRTQSTPATTVSMGKQTP